MDIVKFTACSLLSGGGPEFSQCLNPKLADSSTLKIGASFSENFYGLRRIPLNSTALTRRLKKDSLPRQQILGSLFFIILFPYIKERLDAKFKDLGSGATLHGRSRNDSTLLRDPLSTWSYQKFTETIKSLFLTIYPYVHGSHALAVLSYHILYMFNKTPYFSPYLHILGLKVRRTTQEENVRWLDYVSALFLDSF